MGWSPIKIVNKNSIHCHKNNNGNECKYIGKKHTDNKIYSDKLYNNIKSPNKILYSIRKLYAIFVLSLIVTTGTIHTIEFNYLNKLVATKIEFIVLQSKQADEKLNAQNQQFNDKFAAMMEANDKTYQLILEAREKGNRTVSTDGAVKTYSGSIRKTFLIY
jgi:glucuronate isomerase